MLCYVMCLYQFMERSESSEKEQARCICIYVCMYIYSVIVIIIAYVITIIIIFVTQAGQSEGTVAGGAEGPGVGRNHM